MTGDSNLDHGWAWVITASVLCTNLLSIGYMTAFGVFFVEIVDTFQTTSSLASVIMAVQNGVSCFSALVVHNVLLEVVEVRTCVLIGSVVMAGGIVMASLATSVPTLILTIGGLVGAGHACVFGPGIVLLGQYYNTRRALANSLASMGSSLGSMTLPLLATALLQQYGLRGGLLVYGAVNLHIAVFASFYRPPPKGGGTADTSETGENEDCGEPLLNEDTWIEKAGGADFESGVVQSGGDGDRQGESASTDSTAVTEPPTVDRTRCWNGSGANLNGVQSNGVREISQKFSSMGNVAFRPDHSQLICPQRRSFTLADLRTGFSDARVPREDVDFSLGSQLLRQLRNHALHLSHPLVLGDLAEKDEALHSSPLDRDGEGLNHPSLSRAESRGSDTCLRRLLRRVCGSLSCDPTLFRSPTFWLVQAYMCTGVVGGTVGSAYLPALVQEKGLERSDAAWTMTIWGACNLVGRLLCGLLADRKVLRPARISALTLTVTGLVFTTVSVVPPSRVAWGAFAGVFGMMEGGFFSMLPDIMIGLVGIDRFSRTYGFAIIFSGIFAAAMFPILGGLRDVTGNYHCTYYMMGACAGVAACLLLSDLAVWLRTRVKQCC